MQRPPPRATVERVVADEMAPVADRGRIGRAIAGTMLRSGGSVIVLLVVYYAAPLDRPVDRRHRPAVRRGPHALRSDRGARGAGHACDSRTYTGRRGAGAISFVGGASGA